MKISYSRLKASLGRALELPAPDRGQVIRACGRLEERLRAGASDLSEALGYGTQQLYAAADLLGREALEARVERELGELERQFQVLPLGVLFHISAGNVPGLGAYSVLEGLLTGNVNLLKPSGQDGGVSAFLLKQLVAEEPGLRPFIHVFPFPSSSQDKIRRLASLADAVVMWGGSEAVASVRQLTPPDTRLIEWGHKFSFAYVTAEGMRDEAGLRRLAGHIRGTRQRYCSSCQGIFLDTADIGVAERFRERFGRIWEEAARAGDPGREPTADRFGSPLKEFLPEDVARRTVEAYTVNLEDSLYRPARIGGCFLARLPWGQILTGLRPVAGSIQTVGLLCGAGEWEAYSRRLLRAGATRVCPVEEMSEPAGLISHDGELALRRYCKVVGVRQGVRQQPEGSGGTGHKF